MYHVTCIMKYFDLIGTLFSVKKLNLKTIKQFELQDIVEKLFSDPKLSSHFSIFLFVKLRSVSHYTLAGWITQIVFIDQNVFNHGVFPNV